MASLGAPLGVADISEQAENFEYDSKIKLRHWLRSADNLQKEAQVYEAEGNDAQTYLLLYRHAKLVLDHLAQHPERALPENKKALHAANVAVGRDLAKLERIRPRIAKRHADYIARRDAQQRALEALEGRAIGYPQELHGKALEQTPPQRLSYEKTPLDGGKNKMLAAMLAQREVRRRDIARRSVRQAGVSEEEEERRHRGGVWGDWEKELRRESSEPDDDLSNQLQEVARLQNGHKSAHSSPTTFNPATSTYHYPSIPHTATQHRWSSSDTTPSFASAAPAKPPKEPIHRTSASAPRPPPLPPKPPTSTPPLFEHPRPPPIPGKYADAAPPLPPLPDKHTSAPTSTPSSMSPSPETSTENLDSFNFTPSAYLENGTPLRTVFLPNNLRQQFLISASRNTCLNLETCGILCGILKSNALFITRLLIPEQTSTSDTCETLNEQDYFDYCDKEQLMVLGWIHTHPSQTCFMSSRDLHTHVGYQVMMPESIAIVCAPSKSPSWGIFRLTDPPGKQAILACTQPGIFHPHAVDNIYTEALKPGHVVELERAPLEVVDMRPRK